MKIGDRIKSRREELYMSQDQLAQKTGYKSRSSINKIENGTTDINQTKIVEFAKALDTTPAHLMGWDLERTTEGYTIKTEGDEIKITLDKTVKELSLEDLKKVLDYARFIESQNK